MSGRGLIAFGWWGYFICAAIYVVAGIKAGDWLGLAGSFFFLIATLAFMIHHYSHKGED